MDKEKLFTLPGEEDDRVDGIEKVTGHAKYTADHKPENMVYAVFVTSTIARGAVKNLLLSEAKNAPGVLEILSHLNCPPVPGYQPWAKDPNKKGFEWRGLKVFQNNLVWYYGQPIALVVAVTWEKAVKAAALVKAEYAVEEAETDFEKFRKDPSRLKPSGEYKRGEADAYRHADVFVENEYHTPIETHNPIELHASIAVWEDDDKLTVYDKSQGPKGTQSELARNFGLEEKNVRVITKFVGGAFGSALRSWPHVVAACIAAKMVKRPVRLQLTRRQMFTMVGYRPMAWQYIAIGASREGKLTGITHHAVSITSRYEDFREGIVNASQYLYDCPNVNTSYKILPQDVNTPTWMRGPGEATGAFALESALDELAYKLNMDPVELRIRNYAELHPVNKLPWTSKFLKECYDKGRELVGWSNRPAIPRTLTEDGKLTGYGMGGGVFGASRGTAAVKAVLNNEGKLTLYSAVSDMGPGTATAMVRIAAGILQMPVSKISFLLGDTEFPPGPTQGGSTTTSTVGTAVSMVCETLKVQLIELAQKNHPGYSGLSTEDLACGNETVYAKKDGTKKISLADLLKASGKPQLEILKETGPDPAVRSKYAMNSFSAHFVKLAIDPATGAIELKKVVCTGDGGKIVSPKTARSQMIGGAVGGIGMALTEEALTDTQTGRYLTDTLGTYHVPRHRDVPFIDTWFPDLPDPLINPMGSKGVGEIALIGFAAAVANAVYNATGKRITRLPIKPEMLV
ncbi:MAG: xanthine dehydrogenase family protein molybdopterin-binding subunit [Sphingobacteriales bacterium]|nr:xanthine dehydrogenase family protein molybdopterin-binding subunit [Sphingobacteriales bacterium]